MSVFMQVCSSQVCAACFISLYGRGRTEFSLVVLMHMDAAAAELCRLHSSFPFTSALEGITVACETSSSLLIHEICITEFPDYTYPQRIRLHSQGLKLAESRFGWSHIRDAHVCLRCLHTRAFGVDQCPFVIQVWNCSISSSKNKQLYC